MITRQGLLLLRPTFLPQACCSLQVRSLGLRDLPVPFHSYEKMSVDLVMVVKGSHPKSSCVGFDFATTVIQGRLNCYTIGSLGR